MRPPRLTACTAFAACVALAGSAQAADRPDEPPAPAAVVPGAGPAPQGVGRAATTGTAASYAVPYAVPHPAQVRDRGPATAGPPEGGMRSGRSAGLVVAGGVALVVIGRVVHVLRKRGGGDAE